METLAGVVAFATVAIPVLTEAATAAQAWYLTDSQSIRAAGNTVTAALVGVSVVLTGLIVAKSADAAGYKTRNGAPTAYNAQANPNYGFGPRVRVHPYDVVAGNSIIGRDPDPFIRGEILRAYHSGRGY
jgi:hypothetical protein